jgi:aerobic-type carbon monoxide dehydrogenase small subunit (CoxS/CutS family)
MDLHLTINAEAKTFDIAPKDRLLDVLRANGYLGVKHGCDDGCAARAVLIDGSPSTRAPCSPRRSRVNRS